MSEKIYDVPADGKSRAFIDDAKYKEMYALDQGPERLLGEQAKRVDWMKPFTKVKNTSFAPGNVSIKWFEDGVAQRRLQLHRPPSATQRRPGRDHLGRRRPDERPEDHLQGAARPRSCRFANVLQGARRQEGRPRHHLHADDPGGGLRDARLRAHRRDPFGGVRRLLAGLARRPHPGLRNRRVVITADEGVRGGQKVPLKANTDEAATPRPAASSTCIVVRRTGAHGRR